MRWSCLVCSLVTLVSAGLCWGQQGYRLQSNRVVVDTPEHWRQWQSVTSTIQVTDVGVKPAFFRRNTRLEVDGQQLVVPGINASLNATDFGGGPRDAGSNLAGVSNLMDGRMDTYWEPDNVDPIEDWWVQIDLGRTVSATRIVLKFVDEETGDAFRQFVVTSSQGEVTIGPLLFRTRFTTKKPVQAERVFDIDLTRQTSTKWPNVRGDFTGDVIRYVGVGVRASAFGKGEEVSQVEYEGLPARQQGDIEYHRREASQRLRLLDGEEDWVALAGTDRQGPVVYYRRERPRLAEIEVWSVGDNIGTGVLLRGGAVTSEENNGVEAAVVDGDFFGRLVYWPAQGGFNPDRLLPSQPPDVERSLVVDLGGAFFLDHVRVLNAATSPPGPFRAYRIQLSDGSTNAGGSLAWRQVGELEDILPGETYHGFVFPLAKVKFFSFTYRLFERAGRHGLSEIQFFGEGYMPETVLSSVFGGDSPFIELGTTPQNLASIEWDADLPPGTDLVLQTKTGNSVVAITHYYKKNGEEYPGTEQEASEAHASEKKFFGDAAVGPVVAEVIPGNDWSGWSQRYLHSGDKITSPSPRRYVAVRATLSTDDPMEAATLRSLVLNLAKPVAGTVDGEVLPSRLESIGKKQQMSYFLHSTFLTDSRGFDEILIEGPEGLRMKLKQVLVDVTGQAPQIYGADSDGFEVIVNDSDSLWVRLPAPIKTATGSALIELQFDMTVFSFNTFFIGSVRHSDFENSWQRVEDGDANGVTDSETTVVLALERGGVLDDIGVTPDIFTPNGDGINDEVTVSFSLLRVAAPVPTLIEVYDLSGRLVAKLLDESSNTGRHTVAWNGTGLAGVLVPPGIYLLRIDIDVDANSTRSTTDLRLVHVAY